jgi:hypothetical protein
MEIKIAGFITPRINAEELIKILGQRDKMQDLQSPTTQKILSVIR